MIRYEWIPQKTNQTARNMIFLLFAGAAVLMLCPMLIPALPFRWLFQLIALGLLTAAIFLVTRYQTKLFLYQINESGDFTVTETNTSGKRRITVCRMSISGIQSVFLPETQEQAQERIGQLRKERIRLFDYMADLRPSKSILVIAEEGNETFALRLSYDEELVAYLRAGSKTREQE